MKYKLLQTLEIIVGGDLHYLDVLFMYTLPVLILVLLVLLSDTLHNSFDRYL